jgi:pimeloyl-ACP methyl ester carboxylesterase
MKQINIDIQLKNILISGKVWNPDKKQEILALHGWLDNANSFDNLSPYLEKYKIIAIDFPGHGLSEHYPPGKFYYFIDYVTIIIEVIEELNLDNVILMGHSMGAAIATFVSASLTDKIKKLVVLDTLGPLTNLPQKSAQKYHQFIRQYNRSINSKPPIYPDIDSMIDARKSFQMIKRESVEVLIERSIKKVEDGYTWNFDPKLKLTSPVRLTESQVADFLKCIKCPVFFIKTHKNFHISKKNLENRYRCIKNLKILEIEGFHHFHLDCPEKIASAVNKFLED